ncbi:MAG: bifunctional diguanylate cyclase/phosphodiesterase [Lachnospiraceae bacterium]|nr:bifunctional diguanylate cyclase/phosphodiesterase [Lachnospiraceae bacterium]
MIKQYNKIQCSSIPYFTGRPYTISSDSLMPEEFSGFFRDFNISAGVFLPLTVNDELSMYLGFIESQNPRKWAVEDVRFLNDVKRVLQTILLKRITKNSLASSYAAIDAILENSGCGICVADAIHGSVLYSNDTFNNMLVELSDRMNFENEMMSHGLEESEPGEYYAEASNRWYSVTCAIIRWVDGREVRMCTLYDITPMKAYQKQIEEQANLDDLTGLYNRHRFRKDFQDHIRDAVRSGGDQGTFMTINLDDFKDINDGLGHKNGDTLLVLVAQSLKTICRSSASVYRLGGDEFAILVPYYNEAEVERISETIQKRFEQPWNIGDKDYYCTMCMGLVSYPKDGVSEDTLMQRADYALFEAKKKGKNQVENYNVDTSTHSQRRLDLERCMREAVAGGCKEFLVYYQPLVDINKKNHPCCGAEALVRWQSKELGMVMPNEFISLAEYLGLINSIGEHVLVEACKRCKFWNDFGHPEYKVNVNLSVVQLQQKNIVDTVRNALIYTGVYPGNLTLEVTEGMAAGDVENLIRTLNDLKALGVRLALDDFGTGYSSLSYLRELPLDVIKIDKCFVNEVGEDTFSDAFVKTVAELADTIHVNVIVEGVEEQAQEDALEDMKVHMIQGYLYDKPLTQDEFESKYLD